MTFAYNNITSTNSSVSNRSLFLTSFTQLNTFINPTKTGEPQYPHYCEPDFVPPDPSPEPEPEQSGPLVSDNVEIVDNKVSTFYLNVLDNDDPQVLIGNDVYNISKVTYIIFSGNPPDQNKGLAFRIPPNPSRPLIEPPYPGKVVYFDQSGKEAPLSFEPPNYDPQNRSVGIQTLSDVTGGDWYLVNYQFIPDDDPIITMLEAVATPEPAPSGVQRFNIPKEKFKK